MCFDRWAQHDVSSHTLDVFQSPNTIARHAVPFQSDSSFIDMLNQLRVGECPSALADELISRCGSHALQAARFGPSYRRIVKRVAPDDGHAAAAAGLVLPNPEPGAVALTRTKLSPFNKYNHAVHG